MLRVAIRKLQYNIVNFYRREEPKLIELPDLRVKTILNRADTEHIRIEILEVYRKDSYDENHLVLLINMINDFFNEEEAG
jgi:hypothetical protein